MKGDYCNVTGSGCQITGDYCTGSAVGTSNNRRRQSQNSVINIGGGGITLSGVHFSQSTRIGNGTVIIDGVDISDLVRQKRDNSEEKASPVEKILEKLSDIPDVEDETDDACILCLERKKVIAVMECGHKHLCVECCRKVVQDKNECPHCREPITNVVRVFD